MHERARGVKLNKQVLRELSQVYRVLDLDELLRYREIGEAARLACRLGNKRPFQAVVEDRVEEVQEMSSLVLLQQEDCTLALPGSGFDERLAVFKRQLIRERQARAEARKAARVPADPTTSAAEGDTSMARALVAHGGPGHLDGLRLAPAEAGHVEQHFWRLPARRFCEAGRRSRRGRGERG